MDFFVPGVPKHDNSFSFHAYSIIPYVQYILLFKVVFEKGYKWGNANAKSYGY
jgi:hypothetical protein